MRREFDLIDSLKKARVLDRIGDDCAVLPNGPETDLLITCDTLVESIDFRLDWTDAESLGYKSLAVSLSDIAAMGGRPKYAMISLAVTTDLWSGDFVDRFYSGWFELASEFCVELIGGDISRSPNSLFIDSIVIGEVEIGKAILRSGAKAGDSIYVSGSLGGAAGGLAILNETESSGARDARAAMLIERQMRPRPQLSASSEIAGARAASAMIDLSDGLSSDLAHLCKASCVGAVIDADLLPIDKNLDGLSLNPDESLGLALNGGEDFELLFTSADAWLTDRLESKLSRIGEIVEQPNLIEIKRGGKIYPLPSSGFRHF